MVVVFNSDRLLITVIKLIIDMLSMVMWSDLWWPFIAADLTTHYQVTVSLYTFFTLHAIAFAAELMNIDYILSLFRCQVSPICLVIVIVIYN